MIQTDKLLHALASCVVATVGGAITHLCGGDAVWCGSVAFLSFFVAGMGKELYDENDYGGSDSADWAADIIGGIVGIIITLMFVL